MMSSILEIDWVTEANDEEGVLEEIVDTIGPEARGSQVISMNGPGGGWPAVKVVYSGEPDDLAKRLVEIGYWDSEEAQAMIDDIR